MTHLIAGIAARRGEVHQVEEEEGRRKGALEVSAQTLEEGEEKRKEKEGGIRFPLLYKGVA